MGREPTSKNCHTCRRRRVKCDLAKPGCKRCQKAKLLCQGYEKVLRVHNYGLVSALDSSSPLRLARVDKTTSYPVRSPSPNEQNPSQHVPSTGQPPRPNASPASPELGQTPKYLPQRWTPPPEPSLLPFLDNIAFTYFFDSYSWINVHSILLQDTPMRQHLAEETDSLGQDSLRALAYGLFSHDHHVPALRKSAERLYGGSLQQLQSKLSNASKEELALLIKPIAIMGSYSVSVDRDLRFTHHHGLARLLEHCGPQNFQNPDALPLLESCRMTLISSAIVRRQGIFLEQERWRTSPWSISTEPKTNRSRLLDILAKIPSIMQATDGLLEERSQRVAARAANHTPVEAKETLSTVADLQQRLECVSVELALWRAEWQRENASLASEILEWAFVRIGDEFYRPGIHGAQGPDVYGLNMSLPTDLDIPFPAEHTAGDSSRQPQADDTTFSLMQDVSMYVTVLIWVERLRKNLEGAARSADAIDFYNSPFYTECRCYHTQPGHLRRCQVFPAGTREAKTMAWNIHTPRMSESPVRLVATTSSSGSDDQEASEATSQNPSASPSQEGRLLLPGDGRFAAQLRILNWLVKHLSAGSRPYVLGTLAAMGLSHCVHDVRPSEGNEAIARTIRGTMAKSGFEGAADILLRNYS